MKSLLLLAAALAAPFVCAAGDASTAGIEAGNLRQLLSVHRIYVDRLTGGDTAAQMRDILISSLAASKLFVPPKRRSVPTPCCAARPKTWSSPKRTNRPTASTPT